MLLAAKRKWLKPTWESLIHGAAEAGTTLCQFSGWWSHFYHSSYPGHNWKGLRLNIWGCPCLSLIQNLSSINTKIDHNKCGRIWGYWWKNPYFKLGRVFLEFLFIFGKCHFSLPMHQHRLCLIHFLVRTEQWDARRHQQMVLPEFSPPIPF